MSPVQVWLKKKNNPQSINKPLRFFTTFVFQTSGPADDSYPRGSGPHQTDQTAIQDELISEALNCPLQSKAVQSHAPLLRLQPTVAQVDKGCHVRPVKSFIRPYQTDGGSGIEEHCLLWTLGDRLLKVSPALILSPPEGWDMLHLVSGWMKNLNPFFPLLCFCHISCCLFTIYVVDLYTVFTSHIPFTIAQRFLLNWSFQSVKWKSWCYIKIIYT